MNDGLFEEPVPEPGLPPGAHLRRGWLGLAEQSRLVERAREWAAGPVPMRSALIAGRPMSATTVCLGWHWQPYRYSRHATDVNGHRVPPMPDWLAELGRRAVAETFDDPELTRRYSPDAALVNFYDATARMGMHQDRDERSDDPVVSLSIGDRCRFRFGNPTSRGRPHTDLDLTSGDLFVFGGPSRFAYHGVRQVFPGTAPAGCGLSQGRLNLTLRVTGLSDE